MNGRQQPTDSKNPAKSLNATINLEQMLNGSKSGRVIPQAQRNMAANQSNQGSQRNSQNPVNFVAGDVDPVGISSLLNDSNGISPMKPPAGAAPTNASSASPAGMGSIQPTGNTPLKGRRKQP